MLRREKLYRGVKVSMFLVFVLFYCFDISFNCFNISSWLRGDPEVYGHPPPPRILKPGNTELETGVKLRLGVCGVY